MSIGSQILTSLRETNAGNCTEHIITDPDIETLYRIHPRQGGTSFLIVTRHKRKKNIYIEHSPCSKQTSFCPNWGKIEGVLIALEAMIGDSSCRVLLHSCWFIAAEPMVEDLGVLSGGRSVFVGWRWSRRLHIEESWARPLWIRVQCQTKVPGGVPSAGRGPCVRVSAVDWLYNSSSTYSEKCLVK